MMRALLGSMSLAIGLFSLHAPAAGADDAGLIAAGQKIYEVGLLPSGLPLTASRAGRTTLTGRDAACARCHRRSGFGMTEAGLVVPPITGPALFRNDDPTRSTAPSRRNPSVRDYAYRERPPYNADTLSRAIREGTSPTGYEFEPVMPRFQLDEPDLRALIAYLQQLSGQVEIHERPKRFATIITPGQDVKRSDTVVKVLDGCLGNWFSGDRAGDWKPALDVWRLSGEASTWQRQLDAYFERDPPFLVLSGLGSDEWRPVHEFCEQRRLPCLYPNVDVPGNGLAEDHYNFYFSAGVLGEAQIAANYVRSEAKQRAPARVIQITSNSNSGARAAERLTQELKDTASSVEVRRLQSLQRSDIEAVLADISKDDALVLWLSGDEVEALSSIDPPSAALILASGWLSGLEHAPLSKAWKERALMIYPVDAPERRRTRMLFNLQPALEKFALVESDQILAGNTLAACNIAIESLLRMRGYFTRDYLVEKVESYPAAMGNAPASESFPRFNAGIGQRFSSRGGYIARFSQGGTGMEPIRDWIVP